MSASPCEPLTAAPYPRARTLLGLLCVVAGCGRIGFDELGPAGEASSDAPSAASDAGPGDGALATCSQPAPFLQLIDVIPDGNNSFYTAHYCYAGLPGPLIASMRVATDLSAFSEATVAIETLRADLFVGGANCTACFVRLEANGLVHDGPTTDFIGN